MGIIEKIKVVILNPIIGVMFAFALFYFLLGMFEFMAGKDNADRVEKGKSHIIWGVVGMFIMVSAFGILNLISRTIGVV